MFLNDFLLPWVESFCPRLYDYFKKEEEGVEALNGLNNVHETKRRLREAIAALALAKINEEEITIQEFDEELEIFGDLLNDKRFPKCALDPRDNMRQRFFKALPAFLQQH